jgi:serine-type D-Ala-D-Ala carboxypeptidase (penicillin-binding protein 5/6)
LFLNPRKSALIINIILAIISIFFISSSLYPNTSKASRISNSNNSYYNVKPRVPAKAWLIMDSKSQRIIASYNSNKKLAPASTTKIMTAYVIGRMIQKHQISFNTKIRISKKASQIEGSKMILKEGSQVPVKYLLKGLLVNSGNDAAIALAQGSAGSIKNFAGIMNRTAKSLNLKNSHFVNPNGLPAKNHYSSAKDLAILTNALIKKMPTIYKMCRSKTIRWNKRVRRNTNRLLWKKSLGVDGVKTGYTRNAKYCLVASAYQNKKRVITVLLGANTLSERYSLSEKLIKYGFKNFN